MKRAFALTILCLFVLALAACGGKDEVKPIQKLKAPEWVIKGSGAFKKDNDEQFFYGVGSASGIRDFSLLRSTADNRARSELSKVFETYTSSLMKDYLVSTSAGDAKIMSSEEQNVEQAIKTVTSATLTGSEIVDHWQNPDSGELYSLARLDMASFRENLDRMKELNERTKEMIKENADRLHEELSKEEEKMQAR